MTKPDRCGCNEKISESQAAEWIRSEKADWLVTDRQGRRYTRRGSIVIRATADEVEEAAAQRDAEKQAAAQARWDAKKEKSIREIIASLRNHLTAEQNAQYQNSQLINKLCNVDFCDWYRDGLEARRKMMLAIEGKTGRALVAVLESKEYRAWDAALNLKNLLVSVSRRHYNAILAWNRLGMNRGLHISDAPQGMGKLAYSGLYRDLAKIDDARRLEAEKKGVTQ